MVLFLLLDLVLVYVRVQLRLPVNHINSILVLQRNLLLQHLHHLLRICVHHLILVHHLLHHLVVYQGFIHFLVEHLHLVHHFCLIYLSHLLADHVSHVGEGGDSFFVRLHGFDLIAHEFHLDGGTLVVEGCFKYEVPSVRFWEAEVR